MTLEGRCCAEDWIRPVQCSLLASQSLNLLYVFQGHCSNNSKQLANRGWDCLSVKSSSSILWVNIQPLCYLFALLIFQIPHKTYVFLLCPPLLTFQRQHVCYFWSSLKIHAKFSIDAMFVSHPYSFLQETLPFFTCLHTPRTRYQLLDLVPGNKKGSVAKTGASESIFQSCSLCACLSDYFHAPPAEIRVTQRALGAFEHEVLSRDNWYQCFRCEVMES